VGVYVRGRERWRIGWLNKMPTGGQLSCRSWSSLLEDLGRQILLHDLMQFVSIMGRRNVNVSVCAHRYYFICIVCLFDEWFVFLVCLFEFLFFFGFFVIYLNLLGWWDYNNMKLGFSTELFCMHADLFFIYSYTGLRFWVFRCSWDFGRGGGFREWFVGFCFLRCKIILCVLRVICSAVQCCWG